MLPRANPTVIFKELSDGAVLFAPSTEIYFGLNEVGARIWQSLPPVCESLEDVCTRLSAAYPDVPLDTIRQDTQELLDALVQAGLAVQPSELDRNAGASTAPAS